MFAYDAIMGVAQLHLEVRGVLREKLSERNVTLGQDGARSTLSLRSSGRTRSALRMVGVAPVSLSRRRPRCRLWERLFEFLSHRTPPLDMLMPSDLHAGAIPRFIETYPACFRPQTSVMLDDGGAILGDSCFQA